MPAQRGLPPELPDGVPALVVSYESLVETMRGYDFRGIDASRLGPNQVRAATFTPGGVHVRAVESIPFGKGGSA
jgi:hypothetical protein